MEAPITPICKRSRFAPLTGALILPLLAVAGAAHGRTVPPSPYSAYVQAREAASKGALSDAAAGYAVALAASPENDLLAAQAFTLALEAGDRARAARAAQTLESMGQIATDTRLMLFTEALIGGDDAAARAYAETIGEDAIFGFMAPILTAWIAHRTGGEDPILLLETAAQDLQTGAYAAEHLALMRVARGVPGAAEALAIHAESSGARGARLRIAGAATLVAGRDRRAALALLTGEEPAIAAARTLVERRRPLPGAVRTAEQGIGEFFIDLASDLNRQEVRQLALTFARLATFLAPDNSETWLVTAEILAGGDNPRAALAQLDRVPANDPFADLAAASRIPYLAAAGDDALALALAEARAARAGAGVADWVRVGELRDALDRPADAAEAFERALDKAAEADAGLPLWALHLMRGDALHRADRPGEGQVALEAAYALAPEQPLVLNYLGYSQLERRENLDEAERLIREANRLDPENAAIADSLGWTYYVRGNLPRAITLLEQAAEGEPADPLINEHLGDAYYQAGRRLEARFAWRAALVFAEEDVAGRLRAKIDSGLTPDTAAP